MNDLNINNFLNSLKKHTDLSDNDILILKTLQKGPLSAYSISNNFSMSIEEANQTYKSLQNKGIIKNILYDFNSNALCTYNTETDLIEYILNTLYLYESEGDLSNG